MSSKKLAARLQKGVPFLLDVEHEGGKETLSFRLVFDFNALALVEEKTGYSLLTGTIFVKPNVRKSVVLFWAAIQQHNPEYIGDEGLEVLGTLLSLKNINKATEAVYEAYIQALPDEKAAIVRAALKGEETPAPKEELPSQEASQ